MPWTHSRRVLSADPPPHLGVPCRPQGAAGGRPSTSMLYPPKGQGWQPPIPIGNRRRVCSRGRCCGKGKLGEQDRTPGLRARHPPSDSWQRALLRLWRRKEEKGLLRNLLAVSNPLMFLAPCHLSSHCWSVANIFLFAGSNKLCLLQQTLGTLQGQECQMWSRQPGVGLGALPSTTWCA